MPIPPPSPYRLPTAVLAAFVTASPIVAQPTYPIEIEHALGTTVIDEAPERVATVSWANHEVPLALGVVPVGFPGMTWGDEDGDRLMPWVAARLEELDASTPRLYDEGDGIDFEGVAASNPDVILAAYSSLSQQDYDTLSRIAPVIAYPETPWTTDWRTTIRYNSRGMGLPDEGQELIGELESTIAEISQAHPEFEDERVLFVSHSDASDLSTLGFYAADDPRLRYLEELGLELADAVEKTKGTGDYRGSLSAENVDAFADVTLIVTYGGEDLLTAMQDNPLTSHIPAVQRGAFVSLSASSLGAAANPTALSIPAMAEDYAERLSGALGAE